MKYFRTTLFAAAATFAASLSFAADDIPETAAEPYAAMRLLDPLLGDWTITTEVMTQEGEWRRQSVAHASVASSMNGLLLTEAEVEREPTEATNPALKLDITYDQYRDLYRAAAIDDGWGIMDIYEGNIEEGSLVLTNIRAGTSFPLGDGRELVFRLSLPLEGDTRIMTVDMSDNKGELWRPFYKLTYQRRD